MTIVYKRTDHHRGKYCSAFITGELRAEYQLNKWTEPKVGKLFAFKTERDARNFHIGGWLWKAEAEGVELFRAPVFMTSGGYIRRYAKSFWRKRYNFIESMAEGHGLGEPPVGTVLCSRIRLLKELHY